MKENLAVIGLERTRVDLLKEHTKGLGDNNRHGHKMAGYGARVAASKTIRETAAKAKLQAKAKAKEQSHSRISTLFDMYQDSFRGGIMATTLVQTRQWKKR